MNKEFSVNHYIRFRDQERCCVASLDCCNSVTIFCFALAFGNDNLSNWKLIYRCGRIPFCEKQKMKREFMFLLGRGRTWWGSWSRWRWSSFSWRASTWSYTCSPTQLFTTKEDSFFGIKKVSKNAKHPHCSKMKILLFRRNILDKKCEQLQNMWTNGRAFFWSMEIFDSCERFSLQVLKLKICKRSNLKTFFCQDWYERICQKGPALQPAPFVQFHKLVDSINLQKVVQHSHFHLRRSLVRLRHALRQGFGQSGQGTPKSGIFCRYWRNCKRW